MSPIYIKRKNSSLENRLQFYISSYSCINGPKAGTAAEQNSCYEILELPENNLY